MKQTDKRSRHAAGLARFAEIRDAQARAFVHVAATLDWAAVLGRDPLLRPHIDPEAAPGAAFLAAFGRLVTQPSADPLRLELHRACAFHRTASRTDPDAPHPLAVLLLAQGATIYARKGDPREIGRATLRVNGAPLPPMPARVARVRTEPDGSVTVEDATRTPTGEIVFLERAFAAGPRPGYRRIAATLWPEGRKAWRVRSRTAERDVAAWALWQYCAINAKSRGKGRTLRVDLGDERIRHRAELFGLFSVADLLSLPAFERRFRGTPASRRVAAYRAVASVEALIRAARKA